MSSQPDPTKPLPGAADDPEPAQTSYWIAFMFVIVALSAFGLHFLTNTAISWDQARKSRNPVGKSVEQRIKEQQIRKIEGESPGIPIDQAMQSVAHRYGAKR